MLYNAVWRLQRIYQSSKLESYWRTLLVASKAYGYEVTSSYYARCEPRDGPAGDKEESWKTPWELAAMNVTTIIYFRSTDRWKVCYKSQLTIEVSYRAWKCIRHKNQ